MVQCGDQHRKGTANDKESHDMSEAVLLGWDWEQGMRRMSHHQCSGEVDRAVTGQRGRIQSHLSRAVG